MRAPPLSIFILHVSPIGRASHSPKGYIRAILPVCRPNLARVSEPVELLPHPHPAAAATTAPKTMRANLATLLVVLAGLAAPSEAAKPPAVGYPRQSRRPILTAARKRTEQPSSAQAGLAAGGLASVALASEAIPYANTAILLLVLRQLTEMRSMVDLLDLLISGFSRLGWAVYPVFAGLLVLLQVVPLFSALVLIIVAGALFGPFWGTLLVSVSLSMAATICALIGRIVSERTGFGLADLSEQAASVDAAIAAGPARTSLLLVLLLRLSPVMPFTFSNYLFGLTSTRLWVVFLGTLLGTLPSQTVYVSAGALGRQALQG